MRNPEYYRLTKKGRFVGFKRIVTEYLPAADTKWQLRPVDHDEDEIRKLSQPAVGIATLGRQRIVTVEQKKVKADEDIPPMPEVKPPKEEDVEPQEPKIDQGNCL